MGCMIFVKMYVKLCSLDFKGRWAQILWHYFHLQVEAIRVLFPLWFGWVLCARPLAVEQCFANSIEKF